MIYAAIYLLGCVVCYLTVKADHIKHVKVWTISGRRFWLFISAYSWFGLIAALIVMFTKINSEDRPAKW